MLNLIVKLKILWIEMKVDGSLVDRYKKKVENHKVVAFIIAATFLLTSLTAAMKGLESFIDTAIQGTESLAKLFSTEFNHIYYFS